MELMKDIMAIIGVVLNGLPQGLLALSFGFAAIPTALAFGVGAVGNSVLGCVAPISFQAETITLAGTMGKDMRERLSMIFFGGCVMGLIGVFGLLETIVNFIGPTITNGMMAGVGLMLVKVGIDMVKANAKVGWISLLSACATYLITNDLVYTIIVSVILSSLYAHFTKSNAHIEVNMENEKFKLQKFIINASVVRGALAMVCLNIGANIAFGKLTGEIAGQSVNVDHIAVVSSLADMASSAFGGAPVEAIISATGSAPHPLWAGIGMMVIMGLILVSGLLPRIGKYVPGQSIAGFLFVLGAFVTVPINAPAALGGDPSASLVGGVTMAVTAFTDPFVGMIAGLLVKGMTLIIGL